MSLFILRHGVAEERCARNYPDDFRRPLTADGRERIRLTCAAFLKLELDFDLVLTSPFLRARHTAEIVVQEMNLKKPPLICNDLQPGGDSEAVIAEIKARKPGIKNLLVVGHEPELSRLTSKLISGGPDALIEFKKGGLAKLRFTRSHQPGHFATLAWLLTPRQLRFIAGKGPLKRDR